MYINFLHYVVGKKSLPSGHCAEYRIRQLTGNSGADSGWSAQWTKPKCNATAVDSRLSNEVSTVVRNRFWAVMFCIFVM